MLESITTVDESTPVGLLRAQSQSAYAARLAARLGDGALWDWRGECFEDSTLCGVCACGHTGLRYLFPIYHRTNGDRCIVGSSCIETYQGINPDMVEGMRAEVAKRQAAHRETIRKAKQAAQAEQVQAMALEVAAARVELWRAIALLPDGAWLPRAAWEFCRSVYTAKLLLAELGDADSGKLPRVVIPQLKTPSGQLKRLVATRDNLIAARADVLAKLAGTYEGY